MSIADRLSFSSRTTLPVILQTEAAECGLACLAMVAAWHGLVTDLPTLRRSFQLSLKGVTLADLVGMADRLNFASRPLRLELEELTQLPTPCILHWDLNHFVVLKRAVGGNVEIHDPARGLIRLTLEELSKHFTGVALTLTPTPGFTKHEVRQIVRMRDLFGQTVGLKRSLVQIFSLAIVMELFALVSPLFSQLVVDQVLVSADHELLTVLGVGFTLLMLTQLLVSALRSWVVLRISAVFNLQWSANVFGHLLRLPVYWFERRHLGDITSRFRALNSIEKALTGQVVEALLDGVMAVGTLCMLFLYSSSLASVALLALVGYITVRWFYYERLLLATETQLIRAAKAESHFLETLRGIQSLRMFNATSDRRARWLNLQVDERNAGLSTQKLELGSRIANSLLFGIENIAILWLGAIMVMDNRLSVGMLFAVLALKEQFASRAGNLVNQVVAVRMLRLQAQRLGDIVLTETEDDQPRMLMDSQSLPSTLELRNVSFRYADNESWVLKDCSLYVEEGESVALVGPSGCGKTTLLKLLLGLLQPQQGEVLYGGVDIRKLGLSAYRDRIAAVMQDDQLFAGSIADNIMFFSTAAELERVERSARLAAIHDDIAAMPMGYNTLIGEMGTSISGGQKQRLLLARALYRQPKLLLLDEATSHLDGDNEAQVNAAVCHLQLTRIMIAHRPSTIAMAGRVIRLKGGKVDATVCVDSESLNSLKQVRDSPQEVQV